MPQLSDNQDGTYFYELSSAGGDFAGGLNELPNRAPNETPLAFNLYADETGTLLPRPKTRLVSSFPAGFLPKKAYKFTTTAGAEMVVFTDFYKLYYTLDYLTFTVIKDSLGADIELDPLFETNFAALNGKLYFVNGNDYPHVFNGTIASAIENWSDIPDSAPELKCRFITTHNGVLWIYNSDTLHDTLIFSNGEGEFISTNQIKVNSEQSGKITLCKSTRNGLFVAKVDSEFNLSGYSFDTYQLVNIGNDGCINGNSICEIENGIFIYMSHIGFKITDGIKTGPLPPKLPKSFKRILQSYAKRLIEFKAQADDLWRVTSATQGEFGTADTYEQAINTNTPAAVTAGYFIPQKTNNTNYIKNFLYSALPENNSRFDNRYIIPYSGFSLSSDLNQYTQVKNSNYSGVGTGFGNPGVYCASGESSYWGLTARYYPSRLKFSAIDEDGNTIAIGYHRMCSTEFKKSYSGPGFLFSSEYRYIIKSEFISGKLNTGTHLVDLEHPTNTNMTDEEKKIWRTSLIHKQCYIKVEFQTHRIKEGNSIWPNGGSIADLIVSNSSNLTSSVAEHTTMYSIQSKNKCMLSSDPDKLRIEFGIFFASGTQEYLDGNKRDYVSSIKIGNIRACTLVPGTGVWYSTDLKLQGTEGKMKITKSNANCEATDQINITGSVKFYNATDDVWTDWIDVYKEEPIGTETLNVTISSVIPNDGDNYTEFILALRYLTLSNVYLPIEIQSIAYETIQSISNGGDTDHVISAVKWKENKYLAAYTDINENRNNYIIMIDSPTTKPIYWKWKLKDCAFMFDDKDKIYVIKNNGTVANLYVFTEDINERFLDDGEPFYDEDEPFYYESEYFNLPDAVMKHIKEIAITKNYVGGDYLPSSHLNNVNIEIFIDGKYAGNIDDLFKQDAYDFMRHTRLLQYEESLYPTSEAEIQMKNLPPTSSDDYDYTNIGWGNKVKFKMLLRPVTNPFSAALEYYINLWHIKTVRFHIKPVKGMFPSTGYNVREGSRGA